MQRKRILFVVWIMCMVIGLSSVFGEIIRYPYQFPQGSIHTMHFGDWVLSGEHTTFVVSDLDTHRGQIVSAFLNQAPYNIVENWVPVLNRSPLIGEQLSRIFDSEGEMIGIRVFHSISHVDGVNAITDYLLAFGENHLEIHTRLTNDSNDSIHGLTFQQNLLYTQISPQLLRSRLGFQPFIFVQEEGIAHGLLPIDPGSRISLKSDYGIILYPSFSLEPGQEKSFTTYWYIDHDGFAFYTMLAKRFDIPLQQVEGSVVDPFGKGMPLVKVGAYEENATTRIALTKTDTQGGFRFMLPEGPYVIKIEDGGFESVVQSENRFEVIPPVSNSLVWGPYLTNLRYDGITIQWKSLVNSASTLLLYDADGMLIQSHEIPQRHAISRIPLFDYDLDPAQTIHPDSLYYYEVVLSEGIAPEFHSPRYTFRTMAANPEQYHFVVYGDTRTYDDLHRIVTLEMLKEDPSFVVHTGDLVNNGNFLPDWDNYFDAKRDLAARAAYYPVLGNMETPF